METSSFTILGRHRVEANQKASALRGGALQEYDGIIWKLLDRSAF